MFKHARHAPKPAAGAELRCPHGHIEGLKPPDGARSWRRRQRKEASRIKPR
jgi:hypothetical protein